MMTEERTVWIVASLDENGDQQSWLHDVDDHGIGVWTPARFDAFGFTTQENAEKIATAMRVRGPVAVIER